MHAQDQQRLTDIYTALALVLCRMQLASGRESETWIGLANLSIGLFHTRCTAKSQTELQLAFLLPPPGSGLAASGPMADAMQLAKRDHTVCM